jgi:hypothetical protein
MIASTKLRLQKLGYSVMASRGHSGMFRWWREKPSSGIEVRHTRLSKETFGSADAAWDAAACEAAAHVLESDIFAPSEGGADRQPL